MNQLARSVAVMGREGAYHDTAAKRFFGDATVHPHYFDSFGEVFDAVVDRRAEYGIAAIENVISGPIMPVHDLLQRHKQVTIVGEVVLGIRHALAVVEGSTLKDITEVRSHPVALAQCGNFLLACLPNVTQRHAPDTSTAALEVAQAGDTRLAAIADPATAEGHGLVILHHGIADRPDNRTRFVVLTHRDSPDTEAQRLLADKTSLLLENIRDQPDRIGKLQAALSCFAMAGVQVLRSYEHEAADGSGEWNMFIDLQGGADEYPMRSAVQALDIVDTAWRELGTYRQGRLTE